MIKVQSSYKLEQIETTLGQAAQRHGANIIAVTRVGSLVREEARKAASDAISFTICHADLYGTLLSANLSFAAFLPCRIAAIREGDGVTLATIAPFSFCRYLNRPDLEEVAAPLEALLRGMMEEVSQPASAAHAGHTAGDGALGAHEGQMSMRGSVAQRIDAKGTKIEDLAGTGKLDSPGG